MKTLNPIFCLLVLSLFSAIGCNKNDGYFEKDFASNFQVSNPTPDETIPPPNNDGGTTGSSGDGDVVVTPPSDGEGKVEPVLQEVSEIFNQAVNSTKKLDVIWVIDNSASMKNEQASLGYNFDAFITDFIDKNVDFKMAITTTDCKNATNKGAIVSGSDVKLTSAMAHADPTKFKNDFESMVKVGIEGSGKEKGLEGGEGFMKKYGLSFLRPDAYLAIVILSDEEDQSAQSVDFYTNYYKSFKSNQGLVKIYSIVDLGLTNAKAATTNKAVAAGYQRYADASAATSGYVADLRKDFYKILGDMGDTIIKLLDSFPLASVPVSGTLRVYVNGLLVTNYIYDPATNSIKFEINNLPPAGAEVKVVYSKK